jgi:hypothetical protein
MVPPQFPAETEDRGRTGFRNIVSFLAWDEGKVQNFGHDYDNGPSDSTKWGEFSQYVFLRTTIAHRVGFPVGTRQSSPTLSKWYDDIIYLLTAVGLTPGGSSWYPVLDVLVKETHRHYPHCTLISTAFRYILLTLYSQSCLKSWRRWLSLL